MVPRTLAHPKGCARVMCMRTRSLHHSTYQHLYHIVWGTKYRRKFLKSYTKQVFLDSLFQTARRYPEIYIQQMNIDNDYVHLQIEVAPSISVAPAVQLLKANASKHLKFHFPFIERMYPEGSIWSVGYFSSTVGVNELIIRQYIEKQGRRDHPEDLQQGFEFS